MKYRKALEDSGEAGRYSTVLYRMGLQLARVTLTVQPSHDILRVGQYNIRLPGQDPPYISI